MSNLSTRAFITPAAATPAVTGITPATPGPPLPPSPAVMGPAGDADLSLILPKVTPQPAPTGSVEIRLPIGSSRDVRIPPDAIVTRIGSMPAGNAKREKPITIQNVLGGPHQLPNPTRRDHVLPFDRSDYTGGVDGRPADAVPDRLRPALFVQGVDEGSGGEQVPR